MDQQYPLLANSSTRMKNLDNFMCRKNLRHTLVWKKTNKHAVQMGELPLSEVLTKMFITVDDKHESHGTDTTISNTTLGHDLVKQGDTTSGSSIST